MTDKKEFKDSPSTIDMKGDRVWIFPKKPGGRLHNYRLVVAYTLLALFFIGPFLKSNGQPLFLFNVLDRKFILFGQIFWPQDTHLLIFALLIFVVFVILFTVIYGRVWCGWACPQTVFMEMVFRKIEYWIEGDFRQQKKLAEAAWNTEKIAKKTFKHFIFIMMAAWVAHTFMAYLIGLDRTIEIVSMSPVHNMSGFIGLVFFTVLFYSIFAFLRELACTVVCPYGRLQGAMLDKKSIVVMYDWLRGEPRGKIKKNKAQHDKGDCIDCNLCVQVCPTGIDIRNGTQLECVNCTACIDACDDVMVKINKPKGLIRFDSEEGVEEKKKSLINPRMLAYTVVLLILMGAMGFLLKARTDIDIKINRVAGSMYQVQEDGTVRNMYQIDILNKTFHDIPMHFELEQVDGKLFFPAGTPDTLKSQAKKEAYLMIDIHKDQLKKHGDKIVIIVKSNDEEVDRVTTKFAAPREK